MADEKVVEVMARGMQRAVSWSRFWSDDDARELMRAALAALEKEGYAVVPVERTLDRETIQQCWNAITASIVPGNLPGNGTDQTAQRNGLIIAANILMDMKEAALSDPPKEREMVKTPPCWNMDRGVSG